MSENGEFAFPDPTFGERADFFPPSTKSLFSSESHLPHPLSTSSLSSETAFKLSLPPSMETQIRKLKLSMEPWRELVLHGNSFLLWEKNWHSTALLAATSTIFTIVWLCDPNVLTIISLLGLMITAADLLVPLILASLFKPDAWTGDKQKEYEEICTNIILYKTKAELLLSSYCRMRVTNSKMYYGVTIFSLCCLTWLGGTIDNMLLTYLATTFAILFPGMHHHGMLNKLTETCSKVFNDLVEQAKGKMGQKKAE